MDKLKWKIGFDETLEYISGAAPLPKSVRDFFLSIGIVIVNCYGLSETTGAMTA